MKSPLHEEHHGFVNMKIFMLLIVLDNWIALHIIMTIFLSCIMLSFMKFQNTWDIQDSSKTSLKVCTKKENKITLSYFESFIFLVNHQILKKITNKKMKKEEKNE